MSVQLLQQLVAIHTVDLAGFLDALAAGGGAAQAVHTDLHEVGSGALVHIQNVADDGLWVTCFTALASSFLSILKISNMVVVLSVSYDAPLRRSAIIYPNHILYFK